MLKIFATILGAALSGFIVVALISTPELKESGRLAAYRGGGQIIDYKKLGKDGCTAKAIVPSQNAHIENTMESIRDANSAGFDVIHINIHRTKDNNFVLFHDWTLDCATNGKGEVAASEASLLTELDAGYGYTFDDGQHFPFRNKGYRISHLTTILDQYPHKEFWFNLKNNDEASFVVLHELLRSRYGDRLSDFVIISSEKGVNWFQREAPRLKVISIESTKECVKQYMVYGWSGIFPEACSNRPILIPPDKAKYLWGYPRRFAALAQENGSDIYLWTEHRLLQDHTLDIENGIGVVTGDVHGVKTILR